MELKGSRTEANLTAAFAGESQARNKYTYYASRARKDGYEQIAAIFEETANNEKSMQSSGLSIFTMERSQNGPEPAGRRGWGKL